MKGKQLRVLLLVFLGLLFVALIGVLGGALSSDLPKELTSHPLYIWLLVVISALVAYWLTRLQTTDEHPAPALDEQNCQSRLAAVRAICITGLLEHSVHDAALIALGLREQAEAVANPWRLAVQEVWHNQRYLPAGTHITKVFDDAGGKLLILGAAGAKPPPPQKYDPAIYQGISTDSIRH